MGDYTFTPSIKVSSASVKGAESKAFRQSKIRETRSAPISAEMTIGSRNTHARAIPDFVA